MSETSVLPASDLAALRRELSAHGFDRKPTARVLLELAVHVSVACGGLIVFLLAESLLARIAGLLVSTAGSTGVGTNTHTSSHYATSERRWVNEALTYFGYPLFLGLSATFWWHKHVVVHHPAPNVIGVDEDADFMPWLALTEQDVAGLRGWRRLYHQRLQWPLFPLILLANGFNMQFSGWAYLAGCLRDPGRRSSRHWIDLGCLACHPALAIGLPLILVAWPEALAAYVLRIVLMGYAMFAVLGPGHLPAEAARLSAGQRSADYLLRQTATTVNFRTGTFGRFICSGLEYQIEHHLFPYITHVHYPAVAAVVRDFCRVRGLPYRSYGWATAVWKCWESLRVPRAVETDVEALRRRIS